MTKPLKTAVIGVGYLGRFHAQKYVQSAECELIGLVDSNRKRAEEVAQELSVPFYTDYQAILDQVDAVSIVVPTSVHYDLAKPFIESGVHVLLEKPFAATLDQAQELVDLAQQHRVCLQIGHLERFNVVFKEFKNLIQRPQFIESTRISAFPKRGTDVDVILDLMIHDIDLILALLGERPISVEGMGTPVLTKTVDLANARLKFANGCVANLTASRVSDKAERKLRIFQPGLYLSLNFGTGHARKLQIDPNNPPAAESLKPEVYQLSKGDALMDEIQSFLQVIHSQSRPLVSAEDGLYALEVAWQIKKQIQQQTSNNSSSDFSA